MMRIFIPGILRFALSFLFLSGLFGTETANRESIRTTLVCWESLDSDTRREAINEFMVEPLEALEVAKQLLFEDVDPNTKILCIDLLTRFGDQTILDEFLELAKMGKNDSVRAAAMQAIGSIDTSEAAKLASSFLNSETAPEIVAAALLAFAKIGQADDLSIIERWLDHPDSRIAFSAKFAHAALIRSGQTGQKNLPPNRNVADNQPILTGLEKRDQTLGAEFGSECVRVLEEYFDEGSGVGGSSLVDRYINGEKHLVGFFGDLAGDKPGIGVVIQLTIDLDDFVGITPEGSNGWITYWVDVTLNFSACLPEKLFGQKCLPFGVNLMTHERSPGADDPLRRLNFTALSGNVAGLEVKVGDVGFGGASGFSMTYAGPSTSIIGGEFLSTSGTALRGEIKLGELQGTIGEALSFESGGVNWGRFAENVILTLFQPFGLSHFGIATPTEHRAFTSLDDPFGAPPNPDALMIARVRGGLDANDDGFADNYIPPSGSGTQPTALEKLQVFFFADHTVQDDFRIRVRDVPTGWTVVSEGTDGQQVGDFYDIYNADVNGYYGTHWYIGCTPDAAETVGIDFELYRRNTFWFDELIDTTTAAFKCDCPPTPPGPSTGYPITVVKTGASLDGTVTSDLGTIHCDTDCVRDSAVLDDGTEITLTAIPEPGTVFSGWGGDCSGSDPCTLTINNEMHVTASFNPTIVTTAAPESPANLQANVLSATEIQISWVDTSIDEEGFKIQRKNGSDGAWYHVSTVGPNETLFTNTHLTPCSTYHFRVYSFNEGGSSGFSNCETATTLSNAPQPPSELRAWAISTRKVGLCWLDNSYGSASFEIEQSSNGNDWSVVGFNGTGDTTFTRTVNPYSTRYYRVRAFRSCCGYSDYSNVAMVVACAEPDEPFLEAPYDGETSVPLDQILEWDGDDEVDSWDLYLDTNNPPGLFVQGIPNPSPGDDVQYDPGGLNAGSTYYWQVAANADCDPSRSSFSRIYHFSTIGGPGPVTLLFPADGSANQPTGLVLDWENVTEPGTFLYTLYLGTTTPPPEYADLGTRTDDLVTGLNPNDTYYWKVIARSAENPSLTGESPVWSFDTGGSSSVTTNLLSTKDAGLRSGSFANVNYGGLVGGSTEQRLFGCGNTDEIFDDPGQFPIRGAVEFDLSSIPAGATIQNATLTLRFATANNRPSTASDMYFDPFTTSWAENTITWNNSPSVNTSFRVTGVFPPSGFNPLDNNVTSLVQAWVSGTIANNGFLFSIPSWESVAGRYASFEQSESTAGGTNAPSISITYLEPCTAPTVAVLQSPANGATGQDSSILLDWQDVIDASGYRVFFGTTNPPPEIELTTSSESNVNAPLALSTYYWRVEALATCDPSITSTSSIWSFETSCLAPLSPPLVSPANSVEDQERVVTLTWSSVFGVSNYTVYVSESNPPTDIIGTTSETTFDFVCQPGTRYFWMIEAEADCDSSLRTQSSVAFFDTADAPVADAGDNKTVCSGQTATVGGSPSGSLGLAPYQYSWSIPDGGTLTSSTAANPGFSATDEGIYSVQLVVTDSRGFYSLPSNIFVDCHEPPAFTDTPGNLTVCENSPLTLTVSHTGTAPFSYQWKKDGVDIGGATSATFQVTAVTEEDEGVYTCEVTNDCGFITSTPATLTVDTPVTFVDHPDSVTVCPGEDVEFTADATGTPPLQYQWRKNGVEIQGETGTSLVLAAATPDDSGVYDCAVTNPCGEFTSNQATLTVDGTLRMSLSGAAFPQGYVPISVGFDPYCFVGNLTWYWENLTTSFQFGVDQNPVDVLPIPTETTNYQLVLTDDFDGETAYGYFTVLVHPSGVDLDGDGLNTFYDLWYAFEYWRTLEPLIDADEDGQVTILDFLYINLGTFNSPEIVSYLANPAEIVIPQTSSLEWNCTETDFTRVHGIPGEFAANDSLVVSPQETTSYQLIATGPGGKDSDQVTVTVLPDLSIISFDANPSTIQNGESATLSWETAGATSVSIDQGVGTVALTGNTTLSPTTTTTYTLTATGPGGTTDAQTTVTVNGVPTEGLISHYPFDGNADDFSGNNNHGTENGGIVYGDGVFLQSAAFDGTDDYISAPQVFTGTGDLTVSLWLNMTTMDSNIRKAFSLGADSAAQEVSIYTFENQVRVGLAYQPLTNTLQFIQNDLDYHVVAVLKDGNTVSLYVNGVEAGTDTIAYDIGTGGLAVGSAFDGSDFFFSGSIDEVRIYDRSLTENEIQTLYLAGSDGLVAYYPMDGNPNDVSGYGNHGTLNGGPTYVNGISGQALSFDGSDDYVGVSVSGVLPSGLDDLTLAFWFKSNDAPGYMYDARQLPGERGTTIPISSAGDVGFGIHSGGTSYNFVPNVSGFNDNVWHFLAASREGNTTRLYLDGNLESENIGELVDIGAATPIYLGRRFIITDPAQYFLGLMDEIRVYDRALSQTEIQNLYAEHLDNVVAYYPFSGNADDASGNGYHGTNHGATLTTDRHGNPNSAYHFAGDGERDYIESWPDLPIGNEPRTISVWFRTSDTGGSGGWYWNTIFSYGTRATSRLWTLGVYQSFLTFASWSNDFGTGVPVSDGAWHHAAVVHNGARTTFFLDGNAVGSKTTTYNTASSVFFVGRRSDEHNQYMNGEIDDLRIYDRPLTNSQVQTLYNEGN